MIPITSFRVVSFPAYFRRRSFSRSASLASRPFSTRERPSMYAFMYAFFA